MKITQKLKLEPWHHGYYNTRKGLNGGKRMSVLYEKLETCYKYYQSVTDFVPRVGLILGSGLGGYAKNMKVEKEIPYGDIPGFPVSTVQGHDGKFLLGYIGDVPAVVMKGRVHYYEGYSMQDVVLPTRLMKRMDPFPDQCVRRHKKGISGGRFYDDYRPDLQFCSFSSDRRKCIRAGRKIPGYDAYL